jgi:hypothetical protein
VVHVSIDSTILQIEEDAFIGCTNLVSVQLSEVTENRFGCLSRLQITEEHNNPIYCSCDRSRGILGLYKLGERASSRRGNDDCSECLLRMQITCEHHNPFDCSMDWR